MSGPKIAFFDNLVLEQPSSSGEETVFHIGAEVDENRRKVRYVPYTVRVSETSESTIKHYKKQGKRFTHQSSQMGPYVTPVPAYLLMIHKINSLDAAQYFADRLFHEHTTNNRRNLLYLPDTK